MPRAAFLRLCSILGIWLLAGAAHSQQTAQSSSPVKVGALTLKRQAVPQIFDLPGRAVAYEQVDIRPRVDGVIKKIAFTPGRPLKVGDPLFELDDASYAATVASDQADVAKAEVDLPVKQAAYDRALKLKGQGYTDTEVETALSNLASAKATLEAAKATLNYALTQLSWTKITSPIDGVPEVSEVSVGDLVTSGQSDALTTVTRLDPIYVDMLEPSARLLNIRQKIDNGSIVRNQKLSANLELEDGETYTGNGSMISPSAKVSTSTGTLSIRFQFENADRKILPGMFLRGTVEIGKTQAFLIPQRATDRSATGKLTAYIVGDDGEAKQVSFSSTGTYNNNWIVTDGLKEGQRLILDGLKTMATGTAVDPVTGEIDENGLVKDTVAEDGNGTGGSESSETSDTKTEE
ncbi:efflux RND transporter periplasmic adaptor subunit [Agrobacterium rhizogenes]|nr:efflux RND transporter periplasmic adaptor subunit [Rhizobium rhizogenes]